MDLFIFPKLVEVHCPFKMRPIYKHQAILCSIVVQKWMMEHIWSVVLLRSKAMVTKSFIWETKAM